MRCFQRAAIRRYVKGLLKKVTKFICNWFAKLCTQVQLFYTGLMSSRRTGPKFSVADRNYWKLTEDRTGSYRFNDSYSSQPELDAHRTLPCGLINLTSDYYETESKPYALVQPDTEMIEIINFLARFWELPCPSIVLMVIGEMHQCLVDPDHSRWKNLQDGIIKAANTTPMWIITNGTNGSVGKLIGEALRREEQNRQSQICPLHPESTANNPRLPRITLIGIISEDKLAYETKLTGKGSTIELHPCTDLPENKYELNMDHTHFIVVNDDTFDGSGALNFTVKLAAYLIHSVVSGTTSDRSASLHRSEIPVIGLFIHGGLNSLKLVVELLKSEIPILVLKDSGGAADFVSFAYEEIKEKKRGEWDPEYVEVFVKAELSRKITLEFSKLRENTLIRNRFRERVLECIRYSEQNEQEFLSFLDLQSQSCNFASLEREILRALFRSQKKGRTDVELQYDMLQKDLYLILDWNIPEIALTEVFQKDPKAKFKVDKNVFEEALLRQNREKFLDLFLDQGFQIHKYLTERRLRRLFERAESPQFFRAVCWEEILGHHFVSKIGRDFVTRDLNKLVKMLTGMPNLVSVQELTSNAMGFYTGDPVIAERKALNALIIWAVLFHRPNLAKSLWKRADQPIHLALIIGMIFGNLAKQVRDQMHLYKELDDNSKEFQMMAVGVLEVSFQHNNCRAMDALNEKTPDWNYLTAVDIAALAGNEAFICHPCCQKWLTNRFLGNFHIKEINWGIITIPTSFKIILSAFFILPMYLWIQFYGDHELSVAETDEEAEIDDDHEMSSSRVMQTTHTSRNTTYAEEKDSGNAAALTVIRPRRSVGPKTSSWIMKPKAWHKKANWTKEKPRLWYYRRGPQPPLHLKIYYMWSAPVTKFWTFQITYIMYLAFFSYVVLLPSCGDYFLDSILVGWTFLILVDVIRRAYIQSQQFRSIPVFSKCLEIVLVVCFIIIIMILRIFKIPFIINLFPDPKMVRSAYTARVILCIALLYFYFRLMLIYFPISPTLGPLLYRMKLMVMIDFMNFMRLAMLIIISSGIVIHAVIYPDYPMGKELIRRAFHRTVFSMFLTFIQDLEEDPSCAKISDEYLSAHRSECHMGDTESYRCQTTGVWPYIMSIQFLIIMKLILLTLIYAMFSNTQMEKAGDSAVIWKFQRYRLVVDFYTRLPLPPPLNVFCYLFLCCKLLYKLFCCYYSPCRNKKLELKSGDYGHQMRLKINDYNYWRSVAAQYMSLQEAIERKKEIEKEQLERLIALCHNADLQMQSMKVIKSSILELEKNLQSCRIALEDIQHEFVKTDEKVPTVHLNLLSRQSPYPGTKVQRFLIADKYVPWVVLFSTYDPVVYTKPRTDYPTSVREYVDEDILLLRETQAPHYKLPEMMWNISYTSGGGITIDRTSWMATENGEPIIYKLDSSALPINPVGRTGLRGRGTLLRWGPNHAIYLIVTKMKSEGFIQSVTDSKVVEFIISQKDQSFTWSLPGDLVLHQETIYDVIKEKFGSDSEVVWTVEEMKEFFLRFAFEKDAFFDGRPSQETIDDNFNCLIVQRDYLDDGLNTDNAWIEAEIWHIHYKHICTLDAFYLPRMKWRKSNTQLRTKMPVSLNNILEKVIHKIEGTS